MKISKVNLGEIIRDKVSEKNMSKAEFAKRINVARQNVEKTVFQKHGLDTDLLCRICEVLDCNLFDYFQDTEAGNTNNDIRKELRATLTIEMGAERQDRSFRFVFGENNIEILDK